MYIYLSIVVRYGVPISETRDKCEGSLLRSHDNDNIDIYNYVLSI